MSEIFDLTPVLGKLADGVSLQADEAEAAFNVLMSGDATPVQIGAFLMGLRVKGETVDEITGAARVMRAKATGIVAPDGAIDTCGTGGDGSGTYNISTAAAIVTAACGVPVAKHGNRAASSKSGSADVLAALGVNLDADMNVLAQCLREANICFLMAPRHHSAIRHVMPARKELATRTIFNLLGPLANPAGTKRQVIGVFDGKWVEPIAAVLGNLGSERAWVVHGTGGLDELSTLGPSQVAEWKDGKVSTFEIDPQALGFAKPELEQLKGGDADVNAAAIRELLDNQQSAYRDIVVLNTAAALLVSDAVSSLEDGIAKASAAIADGVAKRTLETLVDASNRGTAQ